MIDNSPDCIYPTLSYPALARNSYVTSLAAMLRLQLSITSRGMIDRILDGLWVLHSSNNCQRYPTSKSFRKHLSTVKQKDYSHQY